MKISLKHVAILVATQFILCAGVWIAAAWFSSDSLFAFIFYLYWPFIVVMAWALALIGQSGMIAPVLLGLILGIIIYSIVFGAIWGYLLKRKTARKSLV